MLNFISKKFRQSSLLHQFGVYLINVCYVLFPVSLMTFTSYFILEQLKTGLISNYFDLNSLLALALISGLFIILFGEKTGYHQLKHLGKSRQVLIILLSLIAMVFSYQSLQNLSEMRYFISLLVALTFWVILSSFTQKDYD